MPRGRVSACSAGAVIFAIHGRHPCEQVSLRRTVWGTAVLWPDACIHMRAKRFVCERGYLLFANLLFIIYYFLFSHLKSFSQPISVQKKNSHAKYSVTLSKERTAPTQPEDENWSSKLFSVKYLRRLTDLQKSQLLHELLVSWKRTKSSQNWWKVGKRNLYRQVILLYCIPFYSEVLIPLITTAPECLLAVH